MTCHYRHCIPPGFVLRKDLPVKKEDKTTAIEDKIDEKRSKLEYGKGTQVTKELFL